jgi:hypothetical protein
MNLLNNFTADAKEVHHLFEDKHPPLLVCSVRLREVFLGQYQKRSVQYCVSIPPSFVGLSKKTLENEKKSFARKYTKFPPAQLLRNWREQRPSNQDDLDLSVMGKVERVLHGGWTRF